MSSTLRLISRSLHHARPTRCFSSTTRLRQSNHKVYFQQGGTTQQGPAIQAQAAPARKNLAGLLWANLILSTAAIYYYTTSTLAERTSTPTTGATASSQAADFLGVQTALHNSVGSNITQLLVKVLISVIEGGPGQNYDPIRDTSVWKKHPLRLADGTKVDENNAVLVRVYDVRGRFHTAILLVNAYEQPQAGGIGALLNRPTVLPRTQWADNTTPIQKWIIDIELEERKKAIANGDPTGASGGMSLIYMTRDTCGVGALDSSGKSDKLNPLKPEEAMMHCAPIREEPFQAFYSLFQRMKTERRGPLVVSPGLHVIRMIPQADGSKLLQLPQSDGSYKDVENVRGEVKGIAKVHSTFSLQEPGMAGSVSDDERLEMRVEEDQSGKTLSARLPHGTWTVISRVGLESGLQTEMNTEIRLVETLPSGKQRELGIVKERNTSGSVVGSTKGDIDN